VPWIKSIGHLPSLVGGAQVLELPGSNPRDAKDARQISRRRSRPGAHATNRQVRQYIHRAVHIGWGCLFMHQDTVEEEPYAVWPPGDAEDVETGGEIRPGTAVTASRG
jgi:hypothetical protein